MSFKNPAWLSKALFYQIYPQSFYDSNGDGIGDINGISAKLDYIQSLGVNALWLNPCFVSPFQDGGYDIADFYRVAPRYGSNADLKRLFKQAHRRGMKVCLDLVAGHTSIDHPWFRASAQHKPHPEFKNRYIWTPHVWNGGDGSMRFINGLAERNGNFGSNFFYCQPALNYGFGKPDPQLSWQQPINAPGPQATRRELKKIMQFWLEMGADGFRVDLANSLIKKDPDYVETKKLWREIRSWLCTDYPDAVLIAEWGTPSEAISAGFHVDFMIHCGVRGYPELFFSEDCFFRKKGLGDIRKFLTPYCDQHAQTSSCGYISIPSGNHDFERPCSGGRDEDDLKVIFTFLLTWPGVPVIYYGDEIGMRYLEDLPSKEGGYHRTGTRTPMQWSRKKNAGFSTTSSQKLYLPLDPDKNRPTVEAQDTDNKSLLNHIRALTALRNSSPALQANGEMAPLYAKSNYPFVYCRKNNDEQFLIAINPSQKPVDISIDTKNISSAKMVIGTGVDLVVKNGKGRLTMKGVSYGVFKTEEKIQGLKT